MISSRVSRFATRVHVASRAISPACLIATRSAHFLPPHPSLLGYDPSKWVDPYIKTELSYGDSKRYLDFPNQMHRVEYSPLDYYKVLLKRLAACSAMLKKDASNLEKSWSDYFPVLVRVSDGVAGLENLCFRPLFSDLTTNEKAAVRQLIETDSKRDCIKSKQVDLEDSVASVKKVACRRLWPQEIESAKAMSAADAQEHLWAFYGVDVKAESEAKGLSAHEFIDTLGVTDELTVARTVDEIKGYLVFLERFSRVVDIAKYTKPATEHLASEKCKNALAALKTASSSDEVEKLATEILAKPQELVKQAMLVVLRDVECPTYIDSGLKDCIRSKYANYHENYDKYDLLGIDKRFLRHKEGKDPKALMKMGIAFWGLMTAAILIISNAKDRAFLKEHGLQHVGHRSVNLFKERE